ncbi:MAG: hypothetical protein F6K25_27410 [Okeania sp. SIO2G4]|uniref:DUF6798 domain-containing protein n=1 Tax=unclassified Okeania TaxID=2634635 RepID=UPI0013B76EEB|nr:MULTISPECIES: DUF6798 domain-containing protein [unclassified Okeania]NEP75316.1 hypothetical protein [Okeania sp. SIO2G5]NEP96394.1 hypothetical protein [Okeania sp. SIO2F5]NEQ94179.1 hypothetical protein [Okeania sp. SIO2G4]
MIFTKTNLPRQVAIYILVITGSLILYGYSFNSSNLSNGIPYIQAFIDPEFYSKDFYVQEFLNFTPRYYYQKLISLTASLGLGLSLTYLLYYIMAFSSLVTSLYFIGKKFSHSILSGALLTFLVLNTHSLEATVGYTSIFRNEPISSIFAMGLAIWGIYYCFCNNWFRGYLFFGFACLLQFLVGFLPGCLFIPILLRYAHKNHSLKTLIISLVIFVGFACLVYVPMKLTGTTNSEILSDSEFIYWYGYIRHPHHIIPSRFLIQEWKSFIFYITGTFLLIQTSDLLTSDDKKNLCLIIYLTLLALAVNYVFVEVYPISLFAKLQLARTTPFAKIVILIVTSVAVTQYYQKGNLAICLLLLFIPTIPTTNNNGMLFFSVVLTIVILQTFDLLKLTRTRLFTSLAIIGLLSWIIFNAPAASISTILEIIFLQLLSLGILSIPFLLQEKQLLLKKFNLRINAAIYTSAIFSVIYFYLGFVQLLPKRLPQINYSQIPSHRLALNFRNLTSKDSLILIPPSQHKFRLYSQRSVVFSFKSFPFTDKGIKQWSERYNILVDLEWEKRIIFPNLDLKYQNLSNEEIIRIAKDFGADYILTKTNWHSNLPLEKLIEDEKWVIYKCN